MSAQMEAAWLGQADDISQKLTEISAEKMRLDRELDRERERLLRIAEWRRCEAAYLAWYLAAVRSRNYEFISRREKAEAWSTFTRSRARPDRPVDARSRWEADHQRGGFRSVDREWLCCGLREEARMNFDRSGNPTPEEEAIINALRYYHECTR